VTKPRRLVAAAALLLVWITAPTSVAAQSADEQPATGSTSPDVLLRAFGAVEWGATQRDEEANSFALGQFALFATSNLTERISVLAEIVLEGGIDTRVVTDLERLQLTFRWNDYLQASAGRYHTGIGFYNTAFHHGAYFETPIGRPRVFEFEDEGGVLPVHDVGVTVRGQIPSAVTGLQYLVEVGNGRVWDDAESAPGADEPARDVNGAKAVNVGLSYRPERWRELEVGTSFYRDTVPFAGTTSIPLRIGTAYLAYRTPGVEVLAEWLMLSHRTTERSHHDRAGYAQVSNAWGRVRPYYRYDRLAIDPDTPFIGAIGSSTVHTFGVRVDPSQWVGLKAQYERADLPTVRGVDAVRTQLVFVF
jgi:hypothetical protein